MILADSWRIGSLMTLVNRGCQRAVRTGAERLSQNLLDHVRDDAATETARRELHPRHPGNPAPRRMRSGPRVLPTRLAPLPGEALDTWLEALAERLPTSAFDLSALPG